MFLFKPDVKADLDAPSLKHLRLEDASFSTSRGFIIKNDITRVNGSLAVWPRAWGGRELEFIRVSHEEWQKQRRYELHRIAC